MVATADELAFGPHWKLKRAKDHISDLSGRIDAFLAERPFKLIAHYRRKAGEVAFRAKTEKPIPPEFSLIIGDAVHNLRSALDLTLYPMACNSSPSPQNIQFPFPRRDGSQALDGAIASRQINFAGKHVAAAIRRLNPTPTGNRDLSGLHALDVRDKHHLMILNGWVPDFTGDDLGALINRYCGITIKGGGSIRLAAPHDQDLLRVKMTFATKDLANSQEEAHVQPPFAIVFGKGQPFENESVLVVLKRLTNKVRDAVAEMIDAYVQP